jgi:GNAT superfamily N-acetyltransferase
MDLAIRPAEPADAPAIGLLLAQLGYSVPRAAIEMRLARGGAERGVLVAVDAVGVAGLLCVSAVESLVSGHEACIDALVVDERARSKGIGGLLLCAAEWWGKERGCTDLVVHSNVIRERAHRFYERCGFATVKSQRFFRKRL